MKMKKYGFILSLIILCTTAAKAQFKDSSLLLMHHASVGYSKEKSFFKETDPLAPNAAGDNRIFAVSYAPTIGKFKKNGVLFFGPQLRYTHGSHGPYVPMDTTSWTIGGIVGKKYFIRITDKVFVTPSISLNAGIGKIKAQVGQGVIPQFGNEFDQDIFYTSLSLQPLQIGYKISKSSLIDFTFFQTSISYYNAEGAYRGRENVLENSEFSITNNFFSAFRFSFTYQLSNRKL